MTLSKNKIIIIITMSNRAVPHSSGYIQIHIKPNKGHTCNVHGYAHINCMLIQCNCENQKLPPTNKLSLLSVYLEASSSVSCHCSCHSMATLINSSETITAC